MPRPSRALSLLLALGAGLVPAPGGAAADSPHRALLERADVLVTVKFVLKVKTDGGADRESEGEITCQAIAPDGLVLCSNTDLGGYVTLMSRLMGRSGSMSAAPSDLEVVLAGETEGRPARLVTRDTDRDLAWILLEEPPAAPLPHLDLADAAEVEVGDAIYYLRRLHKFFDARPIVSERTVGAVVSKPRRLLVPSSPSLPGFGVPVFTASGELVGVSVLQMPGSEDAASFSGGAMSLLGTSVDVQDMLGGLVLPAAEVAAATALVRELLAEETAEEGAAAAAPRSDPPGRRR